MKKMFTIASIVVLAGCTSFLSNVQNAEVATTHLSYLGYVGWTNYYHSATNGASPEKMQQLENARVIIKDARLQFAGAVNVLDAWESAYATNAATEAQVQAALDATLATSSNILWLVKYFQQ